LIFGFFFGGNGVWTQGFTLARQAFLLLGPLSQPVILYVTLLLHLSVVLKSFIAIFQNSPLQQEIAQNKDYTKASQMFAE
jgi:hypothetical protein